MIKEIRKIKPKIIDFNIITFIAFIGVALLPDRVEESQGFPKYTLILMSGILLIYLLSSISKKFEDIDTIKKITGIIMAVFTIWLIVTAKLNILNESMFPSPEVVLTQLVEDHSRLLSDVKSSALVIIEGYSISLVSGVLLGLICGRSKKLKDPITYVSAFIKQIPPIVYIPYAIAILPYYDTVSIFIIIVASFWPIFSCTFAGTANVDKWVVDSAKTLNVKPVSMLFNVILPAILPEIFIGCNQGLTYSFILLTSAEMIGGNSGIGYYIKYYSDFGDFKRIAVGIIVIGVMISVTTVIVNKLQDRLLCWKKK